MTKPTVLITGISGFIAKHCAVEMLNAVTASVAPCDHCNDRLRCAIRWRAMQTSRGLRSRRRTSKRMPAGIRPWQVARTCCTSHRRSLRNSRRTSRPDPPGRAGTLRVLRAAAAPKSSGWCKPRRWRPSLTVTLASELHRSLRRIGRKSKPRGHGLHEVEDARGARSARVPRAGLVGHALLIGQSGLVLGPALDRDIGTSAEIVQMMLQGKYPGVPRMSIACVDVRDVALMHRLAVEIDAEWRRYLGRLIACG